MDRDAQEFIDDYLKELRSDNAAAFVGAGLSRSAGYVDWAGLLRPVATTLGLDVSKEHDLVAVAQYHLNQNAANRNRLNQILIDEFSDSRAPTENHKILARLPIRTFWTTNYDRLIEKALETGGKRVDAKYTQEHLATTKRGRDAVVYKMHGDIEHPNKAVLSRDEYEKYHDTHGAFITALAGDLVEKTFVFLGFSFADPNLNYVLGRIRARYTTDQRRHYCIMKRRGRERGEKKADYDYAVIKQQLMVQDLMNYNIKAILVDEYDDVTGLLSQIENRYRLRTVFISGAATDFGAWGHGKTQRFINQVAAELIRRDFRITSGFGLGVGGAVVTGAVQEIYSTHDRSIEQQLVLRPFPIGIKDAKLRQETFTRYREELVNQAGIAIFLLGNKALDDGSVVESDGMRIEFDLAKQQGLYLIPIGASGWMAKKFWDEIGKDFQGFYKCSSKGARAYFNELGKEVADPTVLVKPLLDLIELLARD